MAMYSSRLDLSKVTMAQCSYKMLGGQAICSYESLHSSYANAMHKALAKREAICQSSTQSVRALMHVRQLPNTRRSHSIERPNIRVQRAIRDLVVKHVSAWAVVIELSGSLAQSGRTHQSSN